MAWYPVLSVHSLHGRLRILLLSSVEDQHWICAVASAPLALGLSFLFSVLTARETSVSGSSNRPLQYTCNPRSFRRRCKFQLDMCRHVFLDAGTKFPSVRACPHDILSTVVSILIAESNFLHSSSVRIQKEHIVSMDI